MTNTNQSNTLQATIDNIEIAVSNLETLRKSIDSVDQLYLKQLGNRLFRLVDHVDNVKDYQYSNSNARLLGILQP